MFFFFFSLSLSVLAKEFQSVRKKKKKFNSKNTVAWKGYE